ncbi:MAG: FAD-binding oxidoreductase, partial [Dehalococcoidia bacterium]|nr:FAD-binding oxidoreductase [Dehalococcoidia bacterium]
MMVHGDRRDLVTKKVYKEFEKVVGPDYVSTDSVHCQAYTGRGYGREQLLYLGLCRPPACVVLPKTTDEVAKLVRICNSYEIPYVPGSTFYVIQATPRFRDDFVVIDLKRMDSLVIDERNMYAIVEPGVVYGQLLAEVLKRDLYTLCPGGGAQVSVLVNHIFCGMGPLCYRIPLSDRRMNAAEWVTPGGEVVRLGSLSSNEKSWFWHDGIGPNLLGLLRGHIPWSGSLGIVTKLSVKLYPFQPEPMTPAGRSPETHSVLPSRMRFYNFSLPSSEAVTTAMAKIAEAQIGAIVTRVPLFWRSIAKAKDRNDFWAEWKDMTEDKLKATYILRVLLVGYTSLKQLEYEEKVLMDIVVGECGGQPRPTRQTDQSLFKMADAAGMWMMTGGYMSNTAGIDGRDVCAETGRRLAERMMGFSPPLMNEHNDPGWYQCLELGHQYYLEIPAYMDPDHLDPGAPAYRDGEIITVLQ